jgi:SOS-response transcriptional repressor LexA
MTFGLTPRQSEVLQFMRIFKMRNGHYPTFAEMQQGLGLKSKSTISRLIECIEKRGHIRRLGRDSRAIEIVDHNEPEVVFSNLVLDPGLQAKLAAFCSARDERPLDVITDAIALHLDWFESHQAKEAAGS